MAMCLTFCVIFLATDHTYESLHFTSQAGASSSSDARTAAEDDKHLYETFDKQEEVRFWLVMSREGFEIGVVVYRFCLEK